MTVRKHRMFERPFEPVASYVDAQNDLLTRLDPRHPPHAEGRNELFRGKGGRRDFLAIGLINADRVLRKAARIGYWDMLNPTTAAASGPTDASSIPQAVIYPEAPRRSRQCSAVRARASSSLQSWCSPPDATE